MILKLKTRKSAAKRVKTKKKFLTRKASALGHFRRKKSSKRKRALKAARQINQVDMSGFKSLLPYSR